MATSNAFFNVPHYEMIERIESLCSSVQVNVRIGDFNVQVPKALLCEQSPYFRACLKPAFEEGQNNHINLEEIEGVVTLRSFQLLVKWLILGQVEFEQSKPSEAITAIIEFSRMADMCGVNGMEGIMAKQIKTIIVDNPPTESVVVEQLEINTYHLTSQHIESAADLPKGHAVRNMLASAAVKGFLLQKKHKFRDQANDIQDFATDLLKVVDSVLKSMKVSRNSASVIDPISGQRFELRER